MYDAFIQISKYSQHVAPMKNWYIEKQKNITENIDNKIRFSSKRKEKSEVIVLIDKKNSTSDPLLAF